MEEGELDRQELPLDTRSFVQMEIEFAEGDGIDYAESRIDERDVEGKVVLVELSGDDVPVRSREIHDLLDERDVTVGRVKDTRKSVEVGSDLPDAPDVTDFESNIDERLADKDLSQAALDVEKMVRKTETTSHVRGEADDIVERAYEERFEDMEEIEDIEDDSTKQTEEASQ